MERFWSAYSLFCQLSFEAIFHQYNGLRAMLLDLCLANKNTLIDISEPVMTCILVSGILVQQLTLQHLNVDVRHNNNALKEIKDCNGGLLHLGLNVITFRTKCYCI